MKKPVWYRLIILVGLSGFFLGTPSARQSGPPDRPQLAPSEDPDALLQALETMAQDFSPEGMSLPSFCLDRNGHTWATWEVWQAEPNPIKVAKLENGRISSLKVLAGPAGFNLTPRLAFDSANSPWIIWANVNHGRSRVFIQPLETGQMWQFDAPALTSLSNPVLVFDDRGIARAFWNETRPGHGLIVSTEFSQGLWSGQQTFRPVSGWPALNPDVLVGTDGLLWVVWMAYDGHDYELFMAGQKDGGWGQEIRLTDNQENDVFPSLSRGSLEGPLITWTRASAIGQQVRLATIKNGRLEKENPLSSFYSSSPLPRFFEMKGETKVLWKPAAQGRMELITLKTSGLSRETSIPPPLSGSVWNSSLDENVYVCFGDSITYGYIDRQPAPELGYPPRLEVILTQNFGPTLAVNQGIGGENTIGGLARIDSVISSLQGRFMLIMEGTNDVITPNLAMSTSAANLQEMVSRCLKAGVYPLLTTILPRHDAYGQIDYYRNRILELNEYIRDMVVAPPISFVDMYEIFNNYPPSDGGLFAVLSNDLKHPSAKGYQVMAESWFDEIKNIPFPPVNIEITSRDGNVSFSPPGRPRFSGWPRLSSTPPLDRTVGTLLRWEHNPKIFDPSRIQGYKVFRKDGLHPQAHFRLVTFVRSPLEFLDPGLYTIDRYSYVLMAVRTDGVEGFCSSEIKE